MSKLRKGLVLALEEMEAENEIPSEPVEYGDEVETRLGADEAVEEVTEAESEVGEMTDAVDDTAADIDTLEDIHDTMEATVESGEGMSEDAAEVAEVAIEAIAARMGIKREGRFMPATESFQSTNSRLMATKIAMEETQSLMSKGWEAILKAIAWIKEKINLFFANLFKNVDRLDAHIKTVRSRVDAVKGDVKKEEVLKKEGLAKALGTDNKADFDTAHAKVEAALEMLSQGEAISKALKAYSQKDATKLSDNAEMLAQMNKLKVTKEFLIGGTIISVASDVDAGAGLISGINIVKQKVPTATEIKALDAGEMYKVLNDCLSLTKAIRTYRVTEKNNNDTLKEIEKKVKAAEKGSEQEKFEGGHKLLKQLHKDATDLISKTSMNFTSVAFQTVNTLVKYVEASAANLGEKPEEAAPEEKKEEEETK